MSHRASSPIVLCWIAGGAHRSAGRTPDWYTLVFPIWQSPRGGEIGCADGSGRYASPAMVVACIAVVLAMTGSAFAARALITGADIKDGSITRADLSGRTVNSLKGKPARRTSRPRRLHRGSGPAGQTPGQPVRPVPPAQPDRRARRATTATRARRAIRPHGHRWARRATRTAGHARSVARLQHAPSRTRTPARRWRRRRPVRPIRRPTASTSATAARS